jgi:5-hydroxyisourate hydrolase
MGRWAIKLEIKANHCSPLMTHHKIKHMISTHILDTSLGNPANGVTVRLEFFEGNQWQRLHEEKTNADGRIAFPTQPKAGTYKLVFLLEEYFQKNKITPFFLRAPVIFSISDTSRKYHIPLLLNPYGYSTYRGS